MRALVTGGAGFIGSHVVDAMVARGDEVTVVDDLSTGREENLGGALEAGAVLDRVDIRDAAAVRAVIERVAPEAILHLAAQIDVRRSVREPGLDARINVEGTVNVLEAARRSGVARFVNTSTGGAIYGETDQIPTSETVPPNPEAPYGTSKYCAERYCELYRRLHGLSTITLRYGNVYGPRQDPLGEAGVVAIFCGRLAQGGRPTVYGDGEQTRDYVFVGDVVKANLAALEHPQVFGEYNIGTGVETSVLDLVRELRELSGRDDFEPEFAPPRPGEVRRSCLDVRLAGERLGWSATTALTEGLRMTLDSSTTG
jgi:UDP-glucose 4-epimerase